MNKNTSTSRGQFRCDICKKSGQSNPLGRLGRRRSHHLPGVCIGPRAVIGAGSVVTRDIPGDVFAAGNACRVIREITD